MHDLEERTMKVWSSIMLRRQEGGVIAQPFPTNTQLTEFVDLRYLPELHQLQ